MTRRRSDSADDAPADGGDHAVATVQRSDVPSSAAERSADRLLEPVSEARHRPGQARVAASFGRAGRVADLPPVTGERDVGVDRLGLDDDLERLPGGQATGERAEPVAEQLAMRARRRPAAAGPSGIRAGGRTSRR